MRIYIIGNDGITLCREAPATVNDGEIAVASNAELHARRQRRSGPIFARYQPVPGAGGFLPAGA